MMKRVFALLFAVLLCLGGITALTGCSSKDDGQTVGEWLAMVEDEFGMYNYRADEPNALGLTEDDPYYETAQIADQWGLLPENGQLDMNSPVTKEFAASTLAKVVGKDDLADMSDQEIAQLSADKGYLAYDYEGKGSDGKKELTPQEAAESVQAAKTKWLDRSGENREEISYRDGVHPITPENMRSPEYSYNPQSNELIIPQNAAADIAEGDSIVIPTNDPNNPQEAYQVQRIETADGYVVIRLNPASLTFEDVYEEFHVKNSIKPVLQDMPVYDGTGRLLNPESLQPQQLSMGEFQAPTVAPLGAATPYDLTPVAKDSLKLDFKVADFSVTGEIEGSAVTFKIEGELPAGKNEKFKSSASFKTDFSTDLETDYSWYGKLEYAYLGVNYTTEQKFALMFEGKPLDHVLTQDNRKKPNLAKMKTSEFRRDADKKVNRSIKICSIRVANGGLLWLDLDIKVNITISGGIELTISNKNTQGIEYVDGKIRGVNSTYKDSDLTAKGKAEATLSIGPMLKAPLDTNIVGASIAGGIGIEATMTAHLADKENVLVEEAQVVGNMETVLPALEFSSAEYHVDLCSDISTYWILKLQTETQDTLLKIEWEHEFFGKDNAKIDPLCTHIEDWKFVPKCTREYGRGVTTTAPNSNNNDNNNQNGGNDSTRGGSQNENANGEPVPFGPTLVIDTLVMFLKPNEGGQVLIKQIPYGYEMSAVQFSTSDSAIATVSQDGQVRAVKAGTATISVATTDQKYKATCTVTVQADSAGGAVVAGAQGALDNISIDMWYDPALLQQV